MRLQDRLNRFRRWLLPEHEDLGWQPFLWLSYLTYLFLPLFGFPRGHLEWLWPTLATLPVFLVLYFRVYRRQRRDLAGLLPIALLSYLLTPFNPAGFTYLTYVSAFAPFAVRGLARALLLTLGLLGLLAAEFFLLGQSTLNLMIAVVICILCCVFNHFSAEAWRKNAALKLSQEEVRRLAAVAERERIGRDLHDLLGRTLSVIALKSELAGKLMDRDRAAAAREIADVTHVAREALEQVRTAVTGIRSAALTTELVSARVLLESCGVQLTCSCDDTALTVQTETALALIVREAATNIQRHSGASRARIELLASCEPDAGTVTLVVSDDGRGGARARGNGLTGISERVRSLGGSLQIDSPDRRGTVLRAWLPLEGHAADAAIGMQPAPLGS